MKRFLPSLAALAMTAACAFTADAETASPTVREGDFYCFRGMPASQINFLPSKESKRNILRGKKLGDSKYDNSDGHDLREIPSTGSGRVLVILVQFADKQFQKQWGDPKDVVDRMLNSENYDFQKATCSAREYFQRISGGQYNPQFELHGPVTVSKKEVDYVTSNPDDFYIDPETGKKVTVYPASRMVEEAIKGLDDEINFADFDSDKDGYCDFVYLFFAGQGATTGGDSRRVIWPHAFTLTAGIGNPVELDGVKVNRYCTSSELGTDSRLSGIGTFCHEFSHVLGLPDLYDTANNNGQASKCFSPGPFSNMDAGNYNNNEKTPPMFSAYEQYAMEWMKPSTLSGTGDYTLLPLEARPFAYQVSSNSNPMEYYILEARGKSFLDQYLPSHGLLAWHIDFDLNIWNANTVNNTPDHQRIDLIEADNSKDMTTREGDAFPGSAGICEFKKNVSPAFKDWNGKDLGYDITEIEVAFDGTVSFKAQSNKQIAPEAVLAAPVPVVKEVSADALTIEWAPVDNANGYYVSVFDYNRMDGSVLHIDDFAEGYYFRNLGNVEALDGVCSAELKGLPANKRFGIMLYAVNDLNASRSAKPAVASTIDGADFQGASTNLILGGIPEGAIAEWNAVEGADSYQLHVVTRTPGDVSESKSYDFSDSRLPQGWKADGKYDNRKFGVAAPSYMLNTPGAKMSTNIYESPIRNLSFWACKRYSDKLCNLDIYALDANGNSTLAHQIPDLEKDGMNYSLPMPANTYGVKFIYNYRSTDLYAYLDDIKLDFHNGHKETPADAEIEYHAEGGSAAVKGLSSGVDYIAYVIPSKADGTTGARSNEVTFRIENLPASGVEEVITGSASTPSFKVIGETLIPSDSELQYDVFTPAGVAVAAACRGNLTLPARGIYIVRFDGGSIKIVL